MASFLQMYGGRRDSCPIELQCSEWILHYFSDCICNFRDSISFSLGLASVACWGVAEIPQILANFLAGNTEGVSIAFLLTWTVGDVFNLAGCVLEPATLPTQFLMALLYTITTIVLVGQTVWYEVIFPRKHLIQVVSTADVASTMAGAEEPQPEETRAQAPTTVINVPLARTPSKEIYISSARSLVSSHTPTMGSFVPGSAGHSWGERHSALHGHSPANGVSQSYNTARAVLIGLVLLNGVFFNLPSNGKSFSSTSFAMPGGTRRLLQASSSVQGEEGDSSLVGQAMGWIMAAIYMGGRFPQIWLNIQRGSVEGLSPLMFLFALLGNATYVGSIVVRSLEWSDIQPNLAWLTDAAVCVLLDIFILGQFVYYSLKNAEQEEEVEPSEYQPLK